MAKPRDEWTGVRLRSEMTSAEQVEHDRNTAERRAVEQAVRDGSVEVDGGWPRRPQVGRSAEEVLADLDQPKAAQRIGEEVAGLIVGTTKRALVWLVALLIVLDLLHAAGVGRRQGPARVGALRRGRRVTPREERAYGQGGRAAWERMLGECLRELGGADAPPEVAVASLVAERSRALAALRSLCDEFGDNDWDDDLDLSDVVEKHLGRHLHRAHLEQLATMRDTR